MTDNTLNLEDRTVFAIIPARSGSKGVIDKNIKPLSGYPLLAYSIATAALCPWISRIIVSTDSVKYARIAEYYGAEAPFIRPAELATDTSSDIDYMIHCLSWLESHNHALPEYLVHLRPTTPLRELDVVNNAIKQMVGDPRATSLRSVHPAHGTPQKWVVINESGYYVPLISSMTMEQVNKPRQEFEPVYIPDGYVDVLKTEFIEEHNMMHGDMVKSFIVPDSVDVDAASDFDSVTEILNSYGHPILNYLRENYKPMDEV